MENPQQGFYGKIKYYVDTYFYPELYSTELTYILYNSEKEYRLLWKGPIQISKLLSFSFWQKPGGIYSVLICSNKQGIYLYW